MGKIEFTDEELNIILDGLEDTKEMVKQRKAKPVSTRYISLLRSIKTKINLYWLREKKKLTKLKLKKIKNGENIGVSRTKVRFKVAKDGED